MMHRPRRQKGSGGWQETHGAVGQAFASGAAGTALAREQMRRGMRAQIADASNSANALRAVRHASKFPPQVARKNVDAPVDRRIFAVEDSFCQVLAMNSTSAGAQKSGEQVKLGCRQFNKVGISSACSRAFIQLEVPNT